MTNSTSRPPLFNYNKAHWDKYLSYIDTHCPFHLIFFFFSEATHTFIELFNDAATSSIPFGNINRLDKTFWSPEIPEVSAKHGKVIARKHCFGQNRQNSISI